MPVWELSRSVEAEVLRHSESDRYLLIWALSMSRAGLSPGSPGSAYPISSLVIVPCAQNLVKSRSIVIYIEGLWRGPIPIDRETGCCGCHDCFVPSNPVSDW